MIGPRGRLRGSIITWAILALPAMTRADVIVNSTDAIDYAGVVATPGQVFQITATGRVSLATLDGPYITDANGTILTRRRWAPGPTTSSAVSPPPAPRLSVASRTSTRASATTSVS
jgi:hypothetical protein